MDELKKAKIAALKELAEKGRAIGRMDRDDRTFLDEIREGLSWACGELLAPKGSKREAPKASH